MKKVEFKKIYNWPGLSRISYRIGTYSKFREILFEELKSKYSLQQWTYRQPDDPGIALIELACILGDILTLYQNEYANELFLKTANQRESIKKLVNLIGYQLSPGVGGKAWFTFEMEGDNEIILSQGFPIQCELDEGTEQVDFELETDVSTFPSFNEVSLYHPVQTKLLTEDTNEFYLFNPAIFELDPGDRLLLMYNELELEKDPGFLNIDITNAEIVTIKTAREYFGRTFFTIDGTLSKLGKSLDRTVTLSESDYGKAFAFETGKYDDSVYPGVVMDLYFPLNLHIRPVNGARAINLGIAEIKFDHINYEFVSTLSYSADLISNLRLRINSIVIWKIGEDKYVKMKVESKHPNFSFTYNIINPQTEGYTARKVHNDRYFSFVSGEESEEQYQQDFFWEYENETTQFLVPQNGCRLVDLPPSIANYDTIDIEYALTLDDSFYESRIEFNSNRSYIDRIFIWHTNEGKYVKMRIDEHNPRSFLTFTFSVLNPSFGEAISTIISENTTFDFTKGESGDLNEVGDFEWKVNGRENRSLNPKIGTTIANLGISTIRFQDITYEYVLSLNYTSTNIMAGISNNQISDNTILVWHTRKDEKDVYIKMIIDSYGSELSFTYEILTKKFKIVAYKISQSFRHFGHNASPEAMRDFDDVIGQKIAPIGYNRSLIDKTNCWYVDPALNHNEFPLERETTDLNPGERIAFQLSDNSVEIPISNPIDQPLNETPIEFCYSKEIRSLAFFSIFISFINGTLVNLGTSTINYKDIDLAYAENLEFPESSEEIEELLKEEKLSKGTILVLKAAGFLIKIRINSSDDPNSLEYFYEYLQPSVPLDKCVVFQIRNGERVSKSGEETVYFIDNGKKRAIPNSEVYDRLFQDWTGILDEKLIVERSGAASEIADYDIIDLIEDGDPLPENAYLFSEQNNTKVYLLDQEGQSYIKREISLDIVPYYNFDLLKVEAFECLPVSTLQEVNIGDLSETFVVKPIKDIKKFPITWGRIAGPSSIIVLDSVNDFRVNNGSSNTGFESNLNFSSSDVRLIQFHHLISPPIEIHPGIEPISDINSPENNSSFVYFGNDNDFMNIKDRNILITHTSFDSIFAKVIKVSNHPPSDLFYSNLQCRITTIDQNLITEFPESIDQSISYKSQMYNIFGNIGLATQGKTEKDIILGSGDNRTSFQAFDLPKSPLTHHFSNEQTLHIEPQLEVYVNGKLWEYVPTLYDSGPEDEVYTIFQNEESKSIIQFGDGITGARVPSGSNNIIVTKQRTGLGAYGLIKKGTLPSQGRNLSNLTKINLLTEVFGGALPHSGMHAKITAPRTVQSLNRLVSLRDYESEMMRIPGVIKARAKWTFDIYNSSHINLTILMESGRVKEYEEVVESIYLSDRYKGPQRYAIQVSQGLFSYVLLKIVYSTDPLLKSEEIENDIRIALGVYEGEGFEDEMAENGLFSLPKRNFGKVEYWSRILGVIQNVPGVRWTNIEALGYFVSDIQDSEEIDDDSLNLVNPPFHLGRDYIPCQSNKMLRLPTKFFTAINTS